ncbi:MAG: PEP-CTERM sorting domain-containing protein [Cyanobacterium sp. T60_A2020_053]|nr:PEP-CTERM sorting domain-containing protein [Cyanobacterium sp. T60_A2020_053]
MNLSRFALISAVSMVALAPVTGAEAINIVSSNFQVTIDSGDLSGETYKGSFSYDLDEMTSEDLFTGFDTRPLTAFSFKFVDVNLDDFIYTDNSSPNNVVNFDPVTGNLFGISYDFDNGSDTLLTFFPDFLDPITVFTYDFDNVQGSGSFQTTPEPSLLLGIGVMGAGLLFGKKKNKK